MIRLRKKNKLSEYIINNNNGSTMIETLVAFLVLMIIMAILMHMINYCFQLEMKSVDTDTVFARFNTELYKPLDAVNSEEVSAQKIETDENLGPVFYLMIDTDKTDMTRNKIQNGTTDYEKYKIGLYSISAKSYKSVNGMIASENLVTPQALIFDYEE